MPTEPEQSLATTSEVGSDATIVVDTRDAGDASYVVRGSGDVLDASLAGKSAQRIALKRARVSEIVFERLSSSTQRLMDAIESVPLTTAKDVQAASTALGILDDHFGGRQQATGSRFGEAEAFDGEVTETAERITRRYRSRAR